MSTLSRIISNCSFLFNDTATTEIYTLSLHDALPIYRHLRNHFLKTIAEAGLGVEFRGDQSGADGIDTDALGSDFLGQPDGEAVDRALGRGIRNPLVRTCQGRGERGYVDDGPARAAVLGGHAPHRLLRAEYDAGDIHLEHAPDRSSIEAVEASGAPGDAGVVDQRGDRPEFEIDALEQLDHVVLDRGVRLHHDRLAAARADLGHDRFGTLLVLQVIHAYRVAALGCELRRRRAYAAARSGNQGYARHSQFPSFALMKRIRRCIPSCATSPAS